MVLFLNFYANISLNVFLVRNIFYLKKRMLWSSDKISTSFLEYWYIKEVSLMSLSCRNNAIRKRTFTHEPVKTACHSKKHLNPTLKRENPLNSSVIAPDYFAPNITVIDVFLIFYYEVLLTNSHLITILFSFFLFTFYENWILVW